MGASEKFGKILSRAVERADGWANALTGIGRADRDKRLSTKMYVDIIDREQQEAIWRGDDMAARIIEKPPGEMMREGFTVHIQDNQAAAEMLMADFKNIGGHAKFREAMEYERAYGGAALLIGANDGATDLRQPLNELNIKSLDWLTLMAAYELHPTAYYSDPQAPKFGEPMIFQLHPDMPAITNIGRSYVQVHESRLIRFTGIKVSRRQLRQNNGWGDSVLVRVNRVLSDFHQSWGSAGILLQDFAQAVLKVSGLADLIATNQDDVIVRRAQALNMSRSTAGMYLLDSEEDYERKATPMTGLPEMLQQFALRLAAAADMPVSLLMGQAPAGMNATGESDMQSWYDRMASRQHTHLKPRLEHLFRLLMLTRGSSTGSVEPDNWSIEFNKLWQPTEKEQAEARFLTAQSDEKYILNGVVSAEEVAVSRFGGDTYSPDIQLDLDGRKAIRQAPKPGDKVRPEVPPLRSPDPIPVAAATLSAEQGVNGGPT
jgi:uncharacterized protein